mmetsp:Transcript_15452/g.39197  ORF Transcript_15452/g.39197 Transcript_15452/m.39197 type:complete len:307 (-) Transcript_15452:65-985(-)
MMFISQTNARSRSCCELAELLRRSCLTATSTPRHRARNTIPNVPTPIRSPSSSSALLTAQSGCTSSSESPISVLSSCVRAASSTGLARRLSASSDIERGMPVPSLRPIRRIPSLRPSESIPIVGPEQERGILPTPFPGLCGGSGNLSGASRLERIIGMVLLRRLSIAVDELTRDKPRAVAARAEEGVPGRLVALLRASATPDCGCACCSGSVCAVGPIESGSGTRTEWRGGMDQPERAWTVAPMGLRAPMVWKVPAPAERSPSGRSEPSRTRGVDFSFRGVAAHLRCPGDEWGARRSALGSDRRVS